jgi:hypothetical protein
MNPSWLHPRFNLQNTIAVLTIRNIRSAAVVCQPAGFLHFLQQVRKKLYISQNLGLKYLLQLNLQSIYGQQ